MRAGKSTVSLADAAPVAKPSRVPAVLNALSVVRLLLLLRVNATESAIAGAPDNQNEATTGLEKLTAGPGPVEAATFGGLTGFVDADMRTPPPSEPNKTPSGRYSSLTMYCGSTVSPVVTGVGLPGLSSKVIRIGAA